MPGRNRPAKARREAKSQAHRQHKLVVRAARTATEDTAIGRAFRRAA
jgi:hypothetical protein